ncbi:uncharacterized protein LOC143506880 [Brachyhypopomus gauderio]|uniref:uncharacterized protein LOC143504706 n=1 Tax=Brachyhypopomus gauderio TaxID=698409 RepID=UPI004041A5AB
MAWVRAVWQEKKRQEEGTVPDSWVDTQNMLLYWPNAANATRYRNDRRKPSDGWRKFPLLKEKMRSDDFNECDNCDFTSSAEVEESPEAKRRRKTKTFEDCLTDDASDSEVEFDDVYQGNGQHPKSNKELELPAPPRKLEPLQERKSTLYSKKANSSSSSSSSGSPFTPIRRKQTSSEQGSPSSSPHLRSRDSSAPLQIQEPTSEMETRSSCHGGQSQKKEQRRSKSPFVQQSTEATCSVQQTPSTQKKHVPYPMPEAKFQRKVMELLVDIREEVRNLKTQSGVAQRCEDSKIPAQASTLEALNLLEKSLESLEEKQKLINGLSKVGGVHLKDNVKRVMEKLMTNEVMANFNMKGGKGKHAFTKLRLFTVVTESVQRTTDATEANIAAAVSFCLKYAPDRVGGGGRKKKT